MEFVEYVGSDGFVHYLLINSMGIPFFFWILLLCGAVSLIYLVLKKIVG